MIRTTTIRCALLMLLLAAGCDILGPTTDSVPPRYVVESYQIAGQSIGPVTLRRSADLSAQYHRDSLGVSGAAVRIDLLSADGAVDTTVYFREQNRPGLYEPRQSVQVVPLGRYRLVIEIADSRHRLTATTTVPDTFSVVTAIDTATYGTGTSLAYRTSASEYPGRQSVYLLDIQALEAEKNKLTPAARRLMNGAETDLDTGGGYTMKDLRRAEWGPVNEETFSTSRAQTLTVTVSWDKVAFFGSNAIDTYVIDDNLYEIIRSDAAQESSSTPGEIPTVVDHIDGGTGVFAGMARARYEVFVQRPTAH